MMSYLKRVGIALSVLLNVVLGGASNQTFSARNWQRKKDGLLNFVWFLKLAHKNYHIQMNMKLMHISEYWGR